MGIYFIDSSALVKRYISEITDIGEVTERIFQFNHSDRILERQLLINVNKYPSPSAWQRINS